MSTPASRPLALPEDLGLPSQFGLVRLPAARLTPPPTPPRAPR